MLLAIACCTFSLNDQQFFGAAQTLYLIPKKIFPFLGADLSVYEMLSKSKTPIFQIQF